MITSESIFTKHEIPLFFLLTYLLGWWIVPFLQGGMLAQGPAFTAVIIIALTAGRQGLREFWGRLTNFRTGWWYLIGPAIILSYQGIAVGINVLLGATSYSTSPNPVHGSINTTPAPWRLVGRDRLERLCPAEVTGEFCKSSERFIGCRHCSGYF